MKASIFCFFFLLSYSYVCAQKCKYKIEYDFSYVEDTTTMRYSSSETYLLYRNKDKSRFQPLNAYHNDSINAEFFKENPDPMKHGNYSQEEMQVFINKFMEFSQKHRLKTRSKYFISRNHKDKMCFNQAVYSIPKSYMIEQINLDWNISSEKTEIKSIPCQKATTTYGGREYIAWFAPSIPIDDGPYVFSGLPGLILKVQDTEKWYTFEVSKVDLEPSSCFWKEELIRPKHVKVDREQYVKIMHRELTNPTFLSGFQGDIEAEKQKLKEKRKGRLDLLLEQL